MPMETPIRTDPNKRHVLLLSTILEYTLRTIDLSCRKQLREVALTMAHDQLMGTSYTHIEIGIRDKQGVI